MSPRRRSTHRSSASRAVRAGDQVFVTGTTAVDGAGVVVGGEDPYLQAQEALRKIGVALAVVSAELSQVVQTRIYLVRAGDWEACWVCQESLQTDGARGAATSSARGGGGSVPPPGAAPTRSRRV